MLRKREVLAAFLNIPSLVFCLHLLLYSSNIGHCPTPRRKETIFLLEKIKVDDGIFSGLNVKRRFSDYRFWNEAMNFVLRVSFTVGLFSYQDIYLASHQMTPYFQLKPSLCCCWWHLNDFCIAATVLNLKLWASTCWKRIVDFRFSNPAKPHSLVPRPKRTKSFPFWFKFCRIGS